MSDFEFYPLAIAFAFSVVLLLSCSYPNSVYGLLGLSLIVNWVVLRVSK